MSRFVIREERADADENPFDRQERIPGWDQGRIGNARVMVVGAGAIGNETLKNLALIGFRNIFIADFDTVSTSNLSRTVLFRKADKGRKKAQVAAERVREMCVADDPRVDWFHGDVVWELGTGAYRGMDLVLGCLDNAETRFAINRQCWLAQKPWIDAGIYELAGSVSVYAPPSPPCYQCGATKEQILSARRRYSCDDFKKSLVEEGKVPTVQVASAIASAIQVQEAAKIVCGQGASFGKKIYFQGRTNDFGVYSNPTNPECLAHVRYGEVIQTPLGSGAKLKEFLAYVSQKELSGEGATLDLRGDRSFIASVNCRHCGSGIDIYKPTFRIYEHEAVCNQCRSTSAQPAADGTPVMAEKERIEMFSLGDTGKRLLEASLHELGVPPLHVVAVADREGEFRYYELSADRVALFPSISTS